MLAWVLFETGERCWTSPAGTSYFAYCLIKADPPRVRVTTHKSPRPFLGERSGCKPGRGDRARSINQEARQAEPPSRTG